ncbi:hypothetical protein OAF65_11225 [Verrucomicrobiales bacterium]|nr:hypothetical protein [Verrucomicrobiales bacterium]MDB4722282.1 hypothetical protein [Verrucomicrobiales bacterium]
MPTGVIDQITLSFPAQTGKSYRIEESTDHKIWSTRESGISGNGNNVQRSFSPNAAKWFLRARE